MERLVASIDRSAKLPTERSTERSDPFPHGLATTGSRAEPIEAGPNEGESNETSYRDATRTAVVPFAERQRRGAKRMRTSRNEGGVTLEARLAALGGSVRRTWRVVRESGQASGGPRTAIRNSDRSSTERSVGAAMATAGRSTTVETGSAAETADA